MKACRGGKLALSISRAESTAPCLFERGRWQVDTVAHRASETGGRFRKAIARSLACADLSLERVSSRMLGCRAIRADRGLHHGPSGECDGTTSEMNVRGRPGFVPSWPCTAPGPSLASSHRSPSHARHGLTLSLGKEHSEVLKGTATKPKRFQRVSLLSARCAYLSETSCEPIGEPSVFALPQ